MLYLEISSIYVINSYSIAKLIDSRVLKPFKIYNLKPPTTAVLVKIVERACQSTFNINI